MGDSFRGGLHVRNAGVNVTRPLVTMTANRDSLRLSTMKPWGWFVRQREFARSDVTSVRVSNANSWMSSGVELATRTEGTVTFWTREPFSVAESLLALGWPVDRLR